MSPNTTRQRVAFFFLGQRPAGSFEGYSHSAVVFAEGLQELGWTISSDVRAWQIRPGGPFMFPGDGPGMLQEADLIIFGEDYFYLQGSDRFPALPAALKAPLIYLERSDLTAATSWINGASLRRLDMICRCHATGYFKYPANVRPTVFGISHRIADSCAASHPVERNTFMWNFNHGKFPHSVRLRAEQKVRPLLASRWKISSAQGNVNEHISEFDQLMRRQTDGRHFTSYYDQLKSAILCSCFGGWFLLPCRQKEAGPFCMWTRKILRRLPITTSLVAQWDSWRLWEAFAAGTAVLHVDFERHRFLTGGPMPEPMKHYIPVSLDKPARHLLPIREQPDELLKIGEAGRHWALEHYSSRPLAARTLQNLGIA